MSYGFCPTCGEPGKSRTRGIPSYDTCERGHTYLASTALAQKPTPLLIDWMKQNNVTLGKQHKGPLVLAVLDHTAAASLRELIGFAHGPEDQGIVIIPFAASVLGYCGAGTRLFRGLVTIPPREGPVTASVFNAWVEQAIVPYLEPAAPRMSL